MLANCLKQRKAMIPTIRDERVEIYKTSVHIKRQFLKFYSELYSKSENVSYEHIKAFLNISSLLYLDNTQKQLLLAPLCEIKIKQIILKMTNG